MQLSDQLQTSIKDLGAAIEVIAENARHGDSAAGLSDDAETWRSTSPTGPTGNHAASPEDVRRARRSAVCLAHRLLTLLTEPAEFIQDLARQNQLLACLHWLGEFQVLACIPLTGCVPMKDVADLAGVPATQLFRTIRFTATAGFLCEPEPGHVAHTPLSAPFVAELSYLDAAMFLAETAAPAALRMAAATRRFGDTASQPAETAYGLAFDAGPRGFQGALEQRTKLQRQWPAFAGHLVAMEDSISELLGKLDWTSLGSSCIVDISGDNAGVAMATALAENYPSLRFVVQVNNTNNNSNDHTLSSSTSTPPSPHITIHPRVPGTLQPITTGAVYILRLAPALLHWRVRVKRELAAHWAVLRGNPAATLLLIAPLLLLPESEPERAEADERLGSAGPGFGGGATAGGRGTTEAGGGGCVEGAARVRDLVLLQLVGGDEEGVVGMRELVQLVRSVNGNGVNGVSGVNGGGGVDGGCLAVVKKLRLKDSATVALGIRYQPDQAGHD
ncbi:uncharacterized protein C8A04DRAFT_31357 [Dichotomopilus funicola]|uniref:O-methyltransferase n=1 Tax=Dichotomopilus funicola TaxID=1934379 RepID=A0AAN6ZKC6_9PEZI|nr:hypothetical protein C8A04DRAFT_31357 [Dichotomopilus funicola]